MTSDTGEIETSVQVFLTNVTTSSGLSLCDEADVAKLTVRQTGTTKVESVDLRSAKGCIAEFLVSLRVGSVRFVGEILGNERQLMVGSSEQLAERGRFDVPLEMSEVAALVVRTSTAGFGGSDTYWFSVDGGESISIGSGTTVTIGAIAAGFRDVRLNAGACGVENASVEVTADASHLALAAFDIDCTGPGNIVLNLQTVGSGGPSTYTLAVAQTDPATHPWEDETLANRDGPKIVQVPAGHYQLELDVRNCLLITPLTDLQLFVPLGGSVERDVFVLCEDQSMIQVITSTSGDGTLPSSYQVIIDEDAPLTMEANDTQGWPVLPGSHSVRLEGLSEFEDCELSGANPTTTSVAEGQTTTVLFVVFCRTPDGGGGGGGSGGGGGTGGIRIVSQTWGSANPPSTYTATLTAAGMPRPIHVFVGVNDSIEVQNLTPNLNPYTVHLDVTKSCGVRGNESVAVDVPSGSTGRVLFDVDCPASGSL